MRVKLMILAFALITGCSFDENQVAMAIAGCEENGGIYELLADGSVRTAECKNGVKLYLREIE